MQSRKKRASIGGDGGPSAAAKAVAHIQAIRLKLDSDYIAREELGFDQIHPASFQSIPVMRPQLQSTEKRLELPRIANALKRKGSSKRGQNRQLLQQGPGLLLQEFSDADNGNFSSASHSRKQLRRNKRSHTTLERQGSNNGDIRLSDLKFGEKNADELLNRLATAN